MYAAVLVIITPRNVILLVRADPGPRYGRERRR